MLSTVGGAEINKTHVSKAAMLWGLQNRHVTETLSKETQRSLLQWEGDFPLIAYPFVLLKCVYYL